MNRPVGVFIINDHRLFREAVAASLNQQSEIVLRGSSADLEEALRQIASVSVDLVLIDAAGGKRHAMKVIWRMKREYPEIKIVILGAEENEGEIVEFIEAGANGYLLKDAKHSELLSVITAVSNEQMPCSPAVAASLFFRLRELSREQRHRQAAGHPRLTHRENEILRLLAADLGNKEIAQRLNLSLSTVKNHVHSILKKLQVQHRRGAGCYGGTSDPHEVPSRRILDRSRGTFDIEISSGGPRENGSQSSPLMQ